jgi:hypothetical protein
VVSAGAAAAAFLAFLCECFFVFFGAIVPASGAGVDVSGVAAGAAGAGVAAAGGASARAGAASSAVARNTALIRGSFIGSP